jgi:DNA-binding sugar fermentation-stimulating protein
MSSGTGHFVLQIVGITEAKVLRRPSFKCPTVGELSDVLITRDNRVVLAHTPSLSCGGLVETGTSVFVAPCPPEEHELYISTNGEQFTHSIFLAYFKEGKITELGPENEQVICINPLVSLEIMESAIEKNLMRMLPPVKQFKRNVPMFLEAKIDSVFSFVGMCEDGRPFVMEVNNVPFAEYHHGLPNAFSQFTTIAPENDYTSKSAYFPEKNTDSRQMIKKINELATIARESSVRCIITYVIERTDIDKFELSAYDEPYRLAIIKAVQSGVCLMPVVVGWLNDGNAIFITDELPVIKPSEML